MSHNIQQRDSHHGVDQAWHGKTIVSKVVEKENVYPYMVEADPLYREGGTVRHGEWFTPVCSDDGGTIGSGPCLNESSYALLSPRDFWDHVEEMIGGTSHKIISAGSVDNRSKLFISVKLNELEKVQVGHREFDIYLNFISSMDRSIPFLATNTSFCTVCENTLLANYFSKSMFKHKFKHSKGSFDQNLESLKKMVDSTFGVAAEFNKQMNSLNNQECKEEDARNILTGFLASEGAEDKIKKSQRMQTRLLNRVDDYVGLFQSGLGNRGETMLDLLSSVTEFNTRTTETKKVSKWISGDYDFRKTGRPMLKAQFARSVSDKDTRDLLEARGSNLSKIINS